MRTVTVLLLLIVLLGCEATPWDGKVAMVHAGDYYNPSLLYINDQFSHSFTNNSQTLAQIPNVGNDVRLQYDYIGKWIYSGGGNPSYLVRTNQITSQKVYLPPDQGTGDWVLAVNENAIVYWGSDNGLAKLYSIPMIGTNLTTDPILTFSSFNQTDGNILPSYLAYDPVTSYIYTINWVGQLYRFLPNGDAFEYVAFLQEDPPVNCTSFYVKNWLFAYNNSVVFNSGCQSDTAYFFRYSVLDAQFSIIGAFPITNYEFVQLTAVDWESNILVSSLYNSSIYQYTTYTMTFDDSFTATSPPLLIADYFVGPAIFFPPAQNSSIQDLNACSFSGTLLNDTCDCDASSYGPTCSQFCSVNLTCHAGTCDPNGHCVCSPGYYYNSTYSSCNLTAVPPLTPPEFFSSILVYYRMEDQTRPLDFYHSTQQSVEKYSSATNQNVFLMNNFRSGNQLQGNGVSCSSVLLVDQNFPIYFMPGNSLLINPNTTFEGIPCQLWETPDGRVTTYTTNWQGNSVPVFINNTFDFTETRFNLSTVSFSFVNYSWMINDICSECENSPAGCVSSTPSFLSSPSRSSTSTSSQSASPTPSRTPTASESSSPTPSPSVTPSVSFSSSASISEKPRSESNSSQSSASLSDSPDNTLLYIFLAAGGSILLLILVGAAIIIFLKFVKRKRDEASYEALPADHL